MANLARQVAVFGIIAVGQLLVILTAGIDLSVGSVLGLTGCITAELLVHGTGIVPAILVGDGRGRRDRRLQRLARRLRQAAAVHRHARHARDRARGGARPHRREHGPTAAGLVRQHRQRRLPRPAEPAVDVRRGGRDRVVRAAADGVRPLRVRGRLEPRVRAPGRRPGDAGARRGVRDLGPAGRGRRRAVHLAPRTPASRRRAPATSSTRSRPA